MKSELVPLRTPAVELNHDNASPFLSPSGNRKRNRRRNGMWFFEVGLMVERERAAEKARTFFDDIWARGDFWGFESSEFEREKYARLIAMLDPCGYDRVLEIGCGAGTFTRLLAPLSRRLLAMDVSSKAISAAQANLNMLKQTEFRVANIMDYDPKKEGPWNLIVFNETICYLGWLYSFFDVSWLASELFAATAPGGYLLLANTQGDFGDPLLLPCVINTYHDLFLNAGYRIDAEEIFRGEKNGVSLDVRMSLYQKPAAGIHGD
jgi:SAM-dependent methyltransferase